MNDTPSIRILSTESFDHWKITDEDIERAKRRIETQASVIFDATKGGDLDKSFYIMLAVSDKSRMHYFQYLVV